MKKLLLAGVIILFTIGICYFSIEKIWYREDDLGQIINGQCAKKDAQSVYRFDSTLIGLTARLFKIGMNCSALKSTAKKLHLKITVGQKGIIPNFVRFYTDQSAASENVALRRTILDATIDREDVVIIDRGLSAGKTFVKFSEEAITFIVRLKVGQRNVNVVETMQLPAVETSSEQEKTLVLLSDQKVQLMNPDTEKFFPTLFRLIKAKSLKTDGEIWFLTNDLICSAYDITELYRRRWDIEVFFRFIKQELNFKHFLARNLNGLVSYLYMVLIFSILLLIYKTSNNLPGYKIVKLKFAKELENEVTAELITFCGGNPAIFWEKFCHEF